MDHSKAALTVLRANLVLLDAQTQVQVFKTEALKALRRFTRDGFSFDLVFLDPPYASDELDECLMALAEGSLLAPAARVVVEHARGKVFCSVAGLSLLDERTYGDTVVTRFQAAS